MFRVVKREIRKAHANDMSQYESPLETHLERPRSTAGST